MAALAGVLLAISMTGVPELTVHERAQLDVAVDRDGHFDGPGILPLLRNAVQWTPPIDDRGATIPHFEQIFGEPASCRGRRYVVRGRLARVVATPPLTRGGPWDGRLREWDVVVEMADGTRGTAVVFLVAPGIAPRTGSDVVVVARFYKIMRRKDVRGGTWTDFPLFVGHSAFATSTPPAESAGRPLLAVLMVIVLVLMTGYVVVRRMTVPSRRRLSRPAVLSGSDDGAVAEAVVESPALSADPAAALNMMRERAEREERQGASDGRSEDSTS